MNRCEWCGNEFEPHPKATRPQKFCRRNCKLMASRQRRYENDPTFREREKARQRAYYDSMSFVPRARKAMKIRRWKAIERRSLRAARS